MHRHQVLAPSRPAFCRANERRSGQAARASLSLASLSIGQGGMTVRLRRRSYVQDPIPNRARRSGRPSRSLRAPISSVSRLVRSCRSTLRPFSTVHWPCSRGPAHRAWAKVVLDSRHLLRLRILRFTARVGIHERPPGSPSFCPPPVAQFSARVNMRGTPRKGSILPSISANFLRAIEPASEHRQ